MANEEKIIGSSAMSVLLTSLKNLINLLAKKSEMSVTNGTGADADKVTIQLKSGTSTTVLRNHQDISGKANSSDVYQKSQTYSKSEVNNLITTPNQQYVTVSATSQTTAATDVLPLSGSADTIYRVANWGGSHYDTSVYTEYAWNGTAYIPLSIKSAQLGLPIVLQNSSTALIEPNKVNYWATPVSTLEITFSQGISGYANEYIIDFTCPSNVDTVLTLPDGITWANDDDLYPEAGMRYQISILDGLAVYAEWEAAQNA